MEILAAEWQEALSRSWNSERPFFFAHVVLMKTLGICKAKEILTRITRQMDLWERGLHVGLVGYYNAEGGTREGRAASGGEEEDKSVARSYHDTVLTGNLRQAVCQATERERGRCLLPDDQCTKTGRPVAEVLQEKHLDM